MKRNLNSLIYGLITCFLLMNNTLMTGETDNANLYSSKNIEDEDKNMSEKLFNNHEINKDLIKLLIEKRNTALKDLIKESEIVKEDIKHGNVKFNKHLNY